MREAWHTALGLFAMACVFGVVLSVGYRIIGSAIIAGLIASFAAFQVMLVFDRAFRHPGE